jgi:hypothetical protein
LIAGGVRLWWTVLLRLPYLAASSAFAFIRLLAMTAVDLTSESSAWGDRRIHGRPAALGIKVAARPSGGSSKNTASRRRPNGGAPQPS